MVNESHGDWYYEMQELGFNYRITDIQCALGISQLKKLDSFIKSRRRIAKIYDEIFYENEFKKLGADVTVATADGSYGVKGFVTNAMDSADYSYFYTCGPEPMLKSLFAVTKTSGQFSFEERMGCGFGACMGCSCKTVTGYKRICKEGPVLEKEEILWEK